VAREARVRVGREVYRIEAEAQGIAGGGWYGHTPSMATPKVKVTYSLSVETLRVLESAAARWGVSKSEAITRAIAAIELDDVEHRLALIDTLQRAAAIDVAEADRRIAALRAEREASRL